MLYNYTDKMTTYEPDPDVLRWGLHLIDVCGLSNASSCGSVTLYDPDLSHIEYVREGHCEPVRANVENDELIAHALQEELSRLAAEEASGVSNVSQDHLQASILVQDWIGPSKRHEHGFDERAANDYSGTRHEGPDDSSGKKNDDADEMGIHSSRWTTYEPDPDVLRWGLHLINACGLSNAGSCGSVSRYDPDLNHIECVRQGCCEPECANVENDELLAHALQEELSRLAAEEASGVSNVSQDHLQASILAQDWLGPSKRHEHGFDERAANDYSRTRKEGPDDPSGKKNDDADEMGINSSRWTSGEKLLSGDEMSNSLDIADESALDGEVGKRLNQMVAVPHFLKINGEIPSVDEEISDHQRLLYRYRKLLEAWKETRPPPKQPEEASRLTIQTLLKRHQKADVEGLLPFYGLPLPQTLDEISVGVPTSLPQGVKFELQTLPVDAKAVADGDTITVYVSTTDPRESSSVPRDVQMAAVQRSKERAEKNYPKADAIHKKIIDSGYRILHQNNEDILAKKYRIRLRGIDAPESSMPYGKEAKEELVKLVQGKCLRVFIYGDDRYGRCVGDVYCNGMFIQELMLKKGLAWHYVAYDQRLELETWEKEARARQVGLWALSNPEKPWDWRKDRREGR